MKTLCLFTFCLLIVSCKSKQLSVHENESHSLLNEVLMDIYKEKETSKMINFEIYTKEIDSEKLERNIRSIKLISKADPAFHIDSTWFNDFYDYNQLIEQSTFLKWDKNKLNFKNINSEFHLKKKIYIEQMEAVIKKDSLSKKQQYDMQVVNWFKENGILNILKASAPIFSKKGDKAILFTSNYSLGETAWLFENDDGIWVLKLQKDIAFY